MADNASEFTAALEDCWSALNDAYWASTTVEAKDQISGALDYVSSLIDVMYVDDFHSRTEQFGSLADQIGVGNKKLDDLKKAIDKLIHKVTTITSVVSSIGRVLNFIPMLPL